MGGTKWARERGYLLALTEAQGPVFQWPRAMPYGTLGIYVGAVSLFMLFLSSVLRSKQRGGHEREFYLKACLYRIYLATSVLFRVNAAVCAKIGELSLRSST